MGYTHYYKRPFDLGAVRFATFSKDVRRLLSVMPEHGVALTGLSNHRSMIPEAGAASVAFNGVGEYGHEGFMFEREHVPYNMQTTDTDSTDGIDRWFDCCKTARKPYDLAVTAVLIAAKHHFGADLLVTSDGTDSEWEPARDLCQDVLGYGKGFSLDR